MTLVRINPVKQIWNTEKEIRDWFNLFNDKFATESESEIENSVWSPATDIVEYDDKFVLHLDLPGISKEDVKIKFANNQLIINGERKSIPEEKKATFHRVERSNGKYYRAFNLPEKIVEDQIKAEFKDGTLTIEIQKAEEVKPKEIEVKVN
jgi:HSP20 family protein